MCVCVCVCVLCVCMYNIIVMRVACWHKGINKSVRS